MIFPTYIKNILGNRYCIVDTEKNKIVFSSNKIDIVDKIFEEYKTNPKYKIERLYK